MSGTRDDSTKPHEDQITICPLLLAGILAKFAATIDERVLCLQWECALWDEQAQQCAVKTLATRRP